MARRRRAASASARGRGSGSGIIGTASAGRAARSVIGRATRRTGTAMGTRTRIRGAMGTRARLGGAVEAVRLGATKETTAETTAGTAATRTRTRMRMRTATRRTAGRCRRDWACRPTLRMLKFIRSCSPLSWLPSLYYLPLPLETCIVLSIYAISGKQLSQSHQYTLQLVTYHLHLVRSSVCSECLSEALYPVAL